MQKKIERILRKERMLTAENLAEITTMGADSHAVVQVLCCLRRAAILTQENFDALFLAKRYALLSDEARQFIWTKNFQQFITQAHYQRIVIAADHRYPLQELKRVRDLIVKEHEVFVLLEETKILDEESRSQVIGHPHLHCLAQALGYLRCAGNLNKPNFNALLLASHQALLTAEAGDLVWRNIPRYYLTQDNYELLLAAAEHHQPLQELRRVSNAILGIGQQSMAFGAGGPTVIDLNPSQSTHTTSVHHSVSASARKLMASYGRDMNLNEIIAVMTGYLNRLPDTLKNAAAKRCLDRIMESEYMYMDTSDVSIGQLLALAWLAMHDKTKCLVALDDALALFVEGLYEIQRGYNLDAFGNDDWDEDQSICVAGAFNKIMEKLNGIHVDVAFYYITAAGASAKFPKLAQEHALTYLDSLSNPETAEEYQYISGILMEIQTSGTLVSIWAEIRAEVQEKLWDEFHEAYGNVKTDYRFLDLLNNGCELLVLDVADLQAKIKASNGYLAYRHKELAESRWEGQISQNSLWSKRHDNSEARTAFDQKYGLIIWS